MRWAALVAWLLTAGGGSILLLTWLRHGGPSRREGIGLVRLVTHAGTALVGLACWIGFIATEGSWLAWVAVAFLAVVSAIGLSMFVRWLRGRNEAQHTELPAEAAFPVPIVIAHGSLALLTVTLSILAAVGV
jgi:hypothetical protein